MPQGRLTAKIALLTAVCSLGMSSIAVAGDQPAPAPPPKPKPAPKPSSPPPPPPSPAPCDDNPDPVYKDWHCTDPFTPSEPGDKPDGEPADDRTRGTESCDDTIGQVCDGATSRPRPVLLLSRLPR
jgi:hypothetical protein